MPEILPNTSLYLCRGINLDTKYENTIYFESLEEQQNYFTSKVYKTIEHISYVRRDTNRLRITATPETLLQANYMFYKNTNYSAKYIYAFITDVIYINDNCCEIVFSIDVLQSFMFDYIPLNCLVDRCHVTNDNIGANITAENFTTDQTVFNSYEKLNDIVDKPLDELYIVLQKTPDNVTEENIGSVVGRRFQGGETRAYRLNSSSAVKQLKKILKDTADEKIIALYMAPLAAFRSFINLQGVPNENLLVDVYSLNADTSIINIFALDQLNNNDLLDGYLPKNKKLYTYPYTRYSIIAPNGNKISYAYENFTNNQVKIQLRGGYAQPISLELQPDGYLGTPAHNNIISTTGQPGNIEMGISIDFYPLCSWNRDTYQAWLNSNSITQAITSALGMAAFRMISIPNNPGITAATSGLSLATELTTNAINKQTQNDKTFGNTSGGSNMYLCGDYMFFAGRETYKAPTLKIIDDFFSLYGYKQNYIMKPQRKARERWTYVKTVNFCCSSNINTSFLDEIKNIWNNGVRWWVNGDEIGHYELSNEPIEVTN